MALKSTPDHFWLSVEKVQHKSLSRWVTPSAMGCQPAGGCACLVFHTDRFPPAKVDLKSSSASHSFGSSLFTTAAFPGLDAPVFTTDSQQSPWLPSSSPSLPASSAQQHYQHLPPQQDFVLFDTPRRSHQPSRSISQSSAIGSASRNHPSASPSTQNQRVAQIIQATGHSTTSTAFTNRLSTQFPKQFYASSAPNSTVALTADRARPARPPVPLFSQSTGNVTQIQTKMNNTSGKSSPSSSASPSPPASSSSQNLHSSCSDLGLDDFTAFGGGASAFPSPAMPGVFDIASTTASTMGTVSPQDLFLSDNFMSAPNSTALTTLTSPSLYNGSPDFGDSYDVSPNFVGNDLESAGESAWFPLFPQENTNVAAPQLPQELAAPTQQQQSPAAGSEDLEAAPSPAPRRKSGNSPTSSAGRHSSVSGVNARRRDKPLPPIVVEDPSDTVAMKRARNTLAARKSRERKAMRFEELEDKLEKLTAERDHFKNLAKQYGAPV
uniref:Cross-pathway control protein 1 n=1 Tax=Pyricularia oryzae (strain P131) TaxID=1143193 RepID=L7JIP0_PYRO1